MILFGIISYYLISIANASPDSDLINNIEKTDNADNQFSSALPHYSDDENERTINSLMLQTKELNREVKDLLIKDWKKLSWQQRFEEDILYVKIRQNASLGVLQAVLRNYKNDTQAINLLAKKKKALKLDIRSFEQTPISALGKTFITSLKVSIMSLHASQVKSLLMQLLDSTDSEKIRNRIDLELFVIELEEISFKIWSSESTSKINLKKVLNALRLTEAPKDDGRRLNNLENKMFNEIKKFTSDYRDKLEKQLGKLQSPEKEQEKQLPINNNTINSRVETTQRDEFTHNVTVHVLEELLEKHVEDISAYVFITEKLKLLMSEPLSTKQNQTYSTATKEVSHNLSHQENTTTGQQTMQKLNEDNKILADETNNFKDQYRKTVETEIQEYLKQFSPGAIDVVMGLAENGSLVFYRDEYLDYSLIFELEQRRQHEMKNFEELQTDVKEWSQTLFREFENLLRKKDNETIIEIRRIARMNVISSFKNVSWSANNRLEKEARCLSDEKPKKEEIPFELFTSFLNSRYKVDSFIFMRRKEQIAQELNELLERIAELMKYLNKMDKEKQIKATIEKNLKMIESVDYTEISLETKEQFDAKFAEASLKDAKTKVLNALKLNQEVNNITAKDFTTREKLIFKRMKHVCQEYKLDLQCAIEKADNWWLN